MNFLINPYQNQNFTQIWNSNWTIPKLFPLILNCSKLTKNTSNSHTNFKPSTIQLFTALFKNSILSIKSIIQLFKLLSNTLKSLSILHCCQLTNATILVPTTTTQTPLGTTFLNFHSLSLFAKIELNCYHLISPPFWH